jgi:hypothetical protein
MILIVETYRRVPDGWAFVLAAVASFLLAAIAGIAAGFAGIYLYDRGNSKGDDLAVLASGILAVGTFAFVMLFTWLRVLHHKISSRTPCRAWLFCSGFDLVITVLLWPGRYPGELNHYRGFIVVGWGLILLLGLVGLLSSRRFFIHQPD